MSGMVFHNIAEGIMSQILKVSMEDARDSSSVLLPRVKEGDLHAADFVLHDLGFDLINGWKGYFKCGDPVWGAVDDSTTRNRLTLVKGSVVGQAYVPDVCGMGARDAVYLMDALSNGKPRHQGANQRTRRGRQPEPGTRHTHQKRHELQPGAAGVASPREALGKGESESTHPSGGPQGLVGVMGLPI